MLDRYQGDARLLAGGQSLVPLLNMRLMQPEAVIDVNRIPDLDGMREDDGHVRIGALARYSAIEWSPIVGARLPLLSEIVRYIGDRQVRTRGTIGGSLAHADPTGEMALAALALDATIVVQSPTGTREIAAARLLPRAVLHRARARRHDRRGALPAPHDGHARSPSTPVATGTSA